ncbi:MAG: hypothetical protein ACJ8EL_09485 [Rhizomicrobium sp.]|jgi:hypothetical protein
MGEDYSGWLWVVMDIAAVVILALVMFYAGQRYAHRNRAKDAVAEAATRRNYAEEDRAAARRGES